MIRGSNKITLALHIASSNLVRVAMIALIVLAAISYVFFANSAVRKVAALEKTKTEMQTLFSELSDLESENFALSQGINNSQANVLGLVEVSPIFISRDTRENSLSLR